MSPGNLSLGTGHHLDTMKELPCNAAIISKLWYQMTDFLVKSNDRFDNRLLQYDPHLYLYCPWMCFAWPAPTLDHACLHSPTVLYTLHQGCQTQNPLSQFILCVAVCGPDKGRKHFHKASHIMMTWSKIFFPFTATKGAEGICKIYDI